MTESPHESRLTLHSQTLHAEMELTVGSSGLHVLADSHGSHLRTRQRRDRGRGGDGGPGV